jgi:cell division transport system ATP-binding protein
VAGFTSSRVLEREIPMLRRKLGVVFQDFRLLRDRTAAENVAFALEVTGTKRSAIAPRVGRLLSQVGLASKAQAYPDELSGGERQRVAVARALANDPFVLLADEPTGNLDEWAAKGILQLFNDINASGMTVLMITHDLQRVREHPRHRVLEMSHGELVFDSAAEHAMEQKGSDDAVFAS